MTITLLARAACVAVLAGSVLAVGPGAAAAGDTTGRVPLYKQQLNDDCEATALRMVLAAAGIQTDDLAVLDRIGVDRVHYRFGQSGPLSGDPFEAFVGDPDGSERAGTGFGVYYPPVARAARSYGLTVLAAGQGITPAGLKGYVGTGNPAIVWVDYLWRNLPSHPYTAYDGRTIPYAGPAEHAVVVTAYTRDSVSINDPARGRLTIPRAQFESGYATYGHMAVVLAIGP